MPRLADPARSGDRHDPGRGERVEGALDVVDATDEVVQGPDVRVDHPPGDVAGLDARRLQHEQVLVAPQAAHLVLADIDEANVVGKHVGDEVVRRARHERLAALGQASDPRGAIHRASVVVAVALLRFPAVE